MYFTFISEIPTSFPEGQDEVEVYINVQGLTAKVTIKEHCNWKELEDRDKTVFEINYESKECTPVDIYPAGYTIYPMVGYCQESKSYIESTEQMIRRITRKLIEKNFSLWQSKRQLELF